ncbi:MMPL family transporter [Jiangella rhizosphaerae]|uniref:MMPL family transporter n=1 Tax=Jiangella rhizosphaerae TaxID=2293569 RepID=A0A418KXC5_9ACTN|nr:MMPL family transporter [Jiangella rhizosphaerae]RIQ35756.1 MMPL family transporter [Jiangella rhizosphaerae]
MATLLYRIGRFSYRSRRLVGAVWLAVIALAGVAAATLSSPTSDSFAIPGTESQEAFDLLQERFPGSSPDGAAARLVFAAPDGGTVTDPAHQQAIVDAVTEIDAGPQVAEVVDPFAAGLVSEDGRIALAEVTYAVDFLSLEPETRETLEDAADLARESGLRVELAGTAVEPEPELGSELLGIAVAALVLVITFGSLIAAGMPLLTGIVGVGVGVALVTAATAFVDLSTITPILATMLGLAVGIDYALFIASRYRHELASGVPGDEAAGRAIGTAGTAVVFAGLTVVIALAGLAVVGIPMLTEMGLAAAVTVAIAVVIALTLLPALFGFAGRRMLSTLPGLRSRAADPEDDAPRLSRRWAGLVTRHPVVALTASIAGLAVLALPMLDVRFGLPDEGTYPADTTQRQAYDLTVEGFGPGFNGPLLVVVDGAGSVESAAADVTEGLRGLDGVALVTPPELDPAGRTAVVTVVPASGPSSPETERLVEAIRSELAGADAPAGAAVLVTGTTALFIDFSERMSQALLPYLLVVVGLSFVLLMLAFRSLVVPLKAALGFLLTMAATFGAMVAAFQWGWLTGVGVDEVGMINSMLPIVVVGIVFGLAMDYEVFLVTRMREAYAHGEPAVGAVTTGFGHGARVVTAAAIIMISVFGGFILNEAADVRQIGFALAVAIAVDAFVVRMTMVPAVLALVGDRAWWLPRWLDRLLPDVDIEGARLTGAQEDQNRQRVAVNPSAP